MNSAEDPWQRFMHGDLPPHFQNMPYDELPPHLKRAVDAALSALDNMPAENVQTFRFTKTFTSGQADAATPAAYWARWEYTSEEWKQLDRLDWGPAWRKFFGIVTLLILLIAIAEIAYWTYLLPVYILPHSVFDINGVVYHFQRMSDIPPDIILMGILMSTMPLLPILILSLLFLLPPLLEAWKRHRARRSGLHRVTIGQPNLLHDQGLWQAGVYIPLQDYPFELKSVKLTENPPLLHFRRKKNSRNGNWSDTVRILVPQGRQEEAAQLVERFWAETIRARDKARAARKAGPAEPV